MTLTDAWLLVKKILVGVVITLVPLGILTGGLYATRHFVGNHARAEQTSSTTGVTHEN